MTATLEGPTTGQLEKKVKTVPRGSPLNLQSEQDPQALFSFTSYNERSSKEQGQKKARKDIEVIKNEMQETGELLDPEHSMYRIINSVAYRLKPEVQTTMQLSVSDSLKAFTMLDTNTIVLSAGLIKEFEEYLKTQGKVLTEDHLALIIGHEISHWDPQAQTLHINERYCDTNALEMCNKAGFSIDAAVEALEFLDSHSGKIQETQSGDSINLGEATHPTSEDRRILIQSIANDPNAYLEGRYHVATPVVTTVLEDFNTRSDAWLEGTRNRQLIKSEEEGQRELEKSTSASQILETFISIDEYHHAQMAKEFAMTKEFGNLLLAMAVLAEMTKNEFLFLDKEDFYAQFRAGLLPNMAAKEPLAVLSDGKSGPSQFTSKTLSLEQQQLIQDCLNGKFEDPLSILALPSAQLASQYPQFSSLNFDSFFKGVSWGINQFIQPKGPYVIGEKYIERAAVVGLTDTLSGEKLVSDKTSNIISSDVGTARAALLNANKTAFASSLLRFSQANVRNSQPESAMPVNAGYWVDLQPDAAEQVKAMASMAPDYQQLQTQMVGHLLRIGACKTKEVAHEMSYLMLSCGRYMEQYSSFSKRKKSLARPQINRQDYKINTQETYEDLRQALYEGHFAFSQGGKELGTLFGKPRIDAFVQGIDGHFRNLATSKDQFQGSVLDPYDTAIKGNATVKVEYEDTILDTMMKMVHQKKIPKIDFVEGLFDRGSDWSEAKQLYCETTDPEIVKKLILNTADNIGNDTSGNRRRQVIDAVMNNADISTNIPLLRNILTEGVTTYKLSPDEIKQILDRAGDLELYSEFISHVPEKKRQQYYEQSFAKHKEELSAQGVAYPEIIAQFVEKGGVIELKGEASDSTYGARLINSSDLGGNWYPSQGAFPENPEISFSQAAELAQRLIFYTKTSSFPHSEEVKQRMVDNAATLIRYSERLSQILEYGLGHRIRIEWLGENISTMEELQERIAKIPESVIRDRCLDSLSSMLLYPKSDYRQNHVVTMEQASLVMRMYSQERLKTLDPGNGVIMASRQLATLPLTAASFDIQEMYPFRYDPNESFVDYLGEFADMLDNQVQDTTSLDYSVKLARSIDAISHPSSVRDFLIERTLLPILRKQKGVSEVTEQQRLDLLERAYDAAHTMRTKGTLGQQIAEIKLSQLKGEPNFDQSLQIILQTMPTRSVSRDNLIQEVLNSTYTTWAQIHRAEALILGNNYETNESDASTRSAVNEAIFRKLQDMDTKEREELFAFLLDKTKHITSGSGLTPAFFDEHVSTNFKKYLKEKSKEPAGQRSFNSTYGVQADSSVRFEFNESLFDTHKEAILGYIMERFKGGSLTYPEFYSLHLDLRMQIGEEGVKMLDELTLPEVLQFAVPTSLNDFLQQQLTSNRVKVVSATSLGPLFIGLNPIDRRQLMYRLCLGKSGVFEERNFPTTGKKILENFIHLSTATPSLANEAKTDDAGWKQEELITAKEVLFSAFEAMTPGRRTEVFSRVINLIVVSGGAVTKEQLIKTVLTAFDVVGAKVGQMDQLLPEYLRDELGSLKEQVPALPKTVAANVLRKSGRDYEYAGIGPAVAAASTATVYLARRRGQEENDRVIKVLRPASLKNVASDLQVVQAVVTKMREQGKISADPGQIIHDLKTMIAEEFNPKNEAQNAQAIQEGRGKGKFRAKALEVLRLREKDASVATIGTPQIDFAGDSHIEMSRAVGNSLVKIQEIQTKATKGETLTEQEQEYATLDMQQIYGEIVSDFFHQAFVTGVFHTDLHQGNIFIDGTGNITQIDHGQVGKEPVVAKRRALVEFVVGIAQNEPKLVALAIQTFDPRLKQEEITTFLQSELATSDLFSATTQYISAHNIQGSINRFTKAMINIYPYMTQLDEAKVKHIIMPYITDPVVLFAIEQTVPGTISDPVKAVIAQKTQEGKAMLAEQFAPLLDEISRFERIKNDPQMQEALTSLMQSTESAGIIGAHLAYLVGSGETIAGRPLHGSLKTAWKIIKLVSGKDKEGLAVLKDTMHRGGEVFRNMRELQEAVGLLATRYKQEKDGYNADKAHMNTALQAFGVEPPQINHG